MRNPPWWCFALLLALFGSVGGSAAQNVKTDRAKDYDFARLKRFAWKQNHLVTRRHPEDNQSLDQAIMRATTRELASKGIIEDAKQPDFYLFYHAGPGDEGMLVGAAAPSGIGNLQPPSSNPDTILGGPNAGFAPNVWYSVEGRFVFYVLDASSNVLVWEATATKKWHDPQKARKNEDKEIRQIVSKSFRDFPPKTKK